MGRGGINSFQKQKRKQERKAWVMSTKQATVFHAAACNLSTGNAVLHRMLLAYWSIVPLDQHMTHRRNQQKALLWLSIHVCHTHSCYDMSGLPTLWKILVESEGVANMIQFRFIFHYQWQLMRERAIPTFLLFQLPRGCLAVLTLVPIQTTKMYKVLISP